MSQLASQAIQFDLETDVERRKIVEQVSDIIDEIDVGGADVLVAVWMPDKDAKTKGSIIIPASAQSEYQYQGVTGLILKMGPLCYRSEKTINWFVDKDTNPNPPRVGEWVSFTFKQGEPFLLRKQPCRLVNDQHILLRIARPDLIV